MIHKLLVVGVLGCNCSVIGDESTGEAIVIDPGDDVSSIEAMINRHQLRATKIYITHAHIDHIGGAAMLQKMTGAPVYLHGSDQTLYDLIDMQANWMGLKPPQRVPIDVQVREGDTIHVGGLEFHAIHTPGHTQGSTCLWMPQQNTLIAGDTLMRDGIGRTDLPGGDARQILQSIKHKLLVLPDQTTVVPGHGDSTTIGREREMNVTLQRL
jgi:hydroxyacylglutathione hydrolase